MSRLLLGALLVGAVSLFALGCSDSGSTPTVDAAGGSDGGDAGAIDAAADASADAAPLSPETVTVFDRVRVNSRGDVNLRKADAELTIKRGAYAKVTLVVDLESSCYPFSKWTSNPPPAGQYWPADCDAFDRNFELHLDPPAGASDPPAIEIQRAITPFGGPLHLEHDITDIANALPGKHTLRVVIPSYSDAKGVVSGSNGGWWVSVKMVTEPGTPPRQVLAVVPLVNHTYRASGDVSGKVSRTFEVPAGATRGKIEYRVTGHGGDSTPDKHCIGPAEEFCQRQHHVWVDTSEIAKPAPWRKDCDSLCTIGTDPVRGDYCKENPCGALRSVRASRANWCPGSLTPPLVYEPAALGRPGQHTFAYSMDLVSAKGSWRVSAVYYAYK